ncbi:hypothetical protein [Methylomonas koyamae]|uniref:hypothetical protein n=1 Tax=Methylomonas koyamae TaxID=702114 RepID=UPI001E2AD62B|nr:hypothetical protein [Methylomonas koyamae]
MGDRNSLGKIAIYPQALVLRWANDSLRFIGTMVDHLSTSTDEFVLGIGFNYPAITLHRVANFSQPIELLPNMGKLGFQFFD